MNSVERVKTALCLGQPDRVPVVEFVIDEKVARAAVPDCRDVADCMDRLDMDCVGCGAFFAKVGDRPLFLFRLLGVFDLIILVDVRDGRDKLGHARCLTQFGQRFNRFCATFPIEAIARYECKIDRFATLDSH